MHFKIEGHYGKQVYLFVFVCVRVRELLALGAMET